MISIKRALLGFAAVVSAAALPVGAYAQGAPPVAPADIKAWVTPTLESCMNLSSDNLKRTPGCIALLEAQNVLADDQKVLETCLNHSAADRTADPACQALWQKFPNIVKLRRA